MKYVHVYVYMHTDIHTYVHTNIISVELSNATWCYSIVLQSIILPATNKRRNTYVITTLASSLEIIKEKEGWHYFRVEYRYELFALYYPCALIAF